MRITESQLRRIIRNEISRQNVTEGFFGDMVNAFKTGVGNERVVSEPRLQKILAPYKDNEFIMDLLRRGMFPRAALEMHKISPLSDEDFKYIKDAHTRLGT